MKRQNLKDEQIFRLSRRDFIKLCGTSSVSLLLAACGYPSATATRSQHHTVTPTATQIPTLTPTVTITPTPTSTIIPITIESGGWGIYTEGEKAGLVDPRIMYPIVGGINHKNRQVIDLKLGDYKLAYDTGEDLTQVQEQKSYRERLLAELNGNDQLRSNLVNVQKGIEKLGESKVVYLEKKQFWVIIERIGEEFKITQVYENEYGKVTRYGVDEEGNLTQLAPEEEPQLLPELRTNGAYIETKDGVRNGEKVQFKGVNIEGFDWSQGGISEAKRYLDIAKDEGLNIIRILYDLSFPDSSQLDQAITYAEQLGMYVIIAPDGINKEQYDRPTLESHNISIEWAKKYKNRNNIIYEPLNEVGEPVGTRWVSDLIQTANEIISINPSALVLFPGYRWNRNFSLFKGKELPPNSMFDVHYYEPQWGRFDPFNFEWLLGLYPVIFGEAGTIDGYRTNPDDNIYISKMISYVNNYPYQAHWLGYAFAPADWKLSFLDSNGGLGIRWQEYSKDLNDSNSISPTDFTA